MTKRVCLEPECPVLCDDTSRCERHTRERDRARGTRQQRGYGKRHVQLRAWWQGRLDAGQVIWCWRCKAQGRWTRIDPECWDLGHRDDDPTRYAGPECRPCNRATAGRSNSSMT